MINCRRNLIKLRVICRTIFVSCRPKSKRFSIATFQSQMIQQTGLWHPLSTPTQRKRSSKFYSSESPRVSTNSVQRKYSSKLRRAIKYAWKLEVDSWMFKISYSNTKNLSRREFIGTMCLTASTIRFQFSKLQLWDRRTAWSKNQLWWTGERGQSRRFQGNSVAISASLRCQTRERILISSMWTLSIKVSWLCQSKDSEPNLARLETLKLASRKSRLVRLRSTDH